MADLTQVIIDFIVFTAYDPKVLLVSDNSNWLHIENEPAIIEITFPGSTKPLVFNFQKNAVNSFNSHNLQLTCLTGNCDGEDYIDLPDGIYTITVKGSPDTFNATKYHLKTDRFQIAMDQLLVQMGFDYNPRKAPQRKKIDEVSFLKKVAEAHIRRQDVGKAKTFFDQAQQELKRLQDCFEDSDCN